MGYKPGLVVRSSRIRVSVSNKTQMVNVRPDEDSDVLFLEIQTCIRHSAGQNDFLYGLAVGCRDIHTVTIVLRFH